MEQFDIVRIFFGNTTWTDVAEIIFRTSVLFVFTFIMLRLVGHRGLGQLSLSEFVLIIGLGSAVGDPMFYFDIPLIHGMIVITVIVVYQVLLTTSTMKFPKLADVVDGRATRLVVDGMVDLDGLRMSRLTHQELFAELRQKDVTQLGEVQRAYLEQDGQISSFKFAEGEAKIGLPILPIHIEDLTTIRKGESIPYNQTFACQHCGYTRDWKSVASADACPRCQQDVWVSIVTSETVFTAG